MSSAPRYTHAFFTASDRFLTNVQSRIKARSFAFRRENTLLYRGFCRPYVKQANSASSPRSSSQTSGLYCQLQSLDSSKATAPEVAQNRNRTSCAGTKNEDCFAHCTCLLPMSIDAEQRSPNGRFANGAIIPYRGALLVVWVHEEKTALQAIFRVLQVFETVLACSWEVCHVLCNKMHEDSQCRMSRSPYHYGLALMPCSSDCRL